MARLRSQQVKARQENTSGSGRHNGRVQGAGVRHVKDVGFVIPEAQRQK